jgi:acetyl esterase/lipase
MNLLDRTPPRADYRLPYGDLPLQFGDLWLPPSRKPNQLHPLIVFFHGGWWSNAFDLNYAGFLCQAMAAQGAAVWSIEYRRIGDPGGGWPGTFQDAAAGMDFVPKLAQTFPLDISHILAAGHSAGGQLAFWLAGRHHIPHTSVLASPQPNLALKGLVSLAGAVDLRLILALGGIFRFNNGGPAVRSLMGGRPAEYPDRYAAADPGLLLPLGVPQILVQGTNDDQIPSQLPQRWADNARRQGDHVQLDIIPDADHFDIVDPESAAWHISRDAMLTLLHASRH